MREQGVTMRIVGLIAVGGLVAGASAAHAGDGVKGLRQPRTFPLMITNPGSYGLTGNITVPDVNTTAIEIHADDVTLDLNGFVVGGPNVCDEAGSCSTNVGGTGIDGADNGDGVNITVLNGTVRGMGGTGSS